MNQTAKWIGIITDKTIGAGANDMAVGSPAPYFRREFTVAKPVRQALLTMSACGLYQGFLNGKQTDGELFKPQWSDYRKSIDFRTFDVTQLIQTGVNCVGAVLGDGWYCGKISIIGRQLYGQYPLKLFLSLELRYEDGSTERIESDESFSAGTGRIRENDFQDGETHDNRMPHEACFTPGFSAEGWRSAEVLSTDGSLLHQAYAPAVAYREQFEAKFLHRDDQGRYLYDIGQNLSGNIRAVVRARPGQTVRFRFGEMLDHDALYTDNLRKAKATDRLICGGVGEDCFEPLFTFHGFRYIEVTLPEDAQLVSLTVRACYSDLAVTGSFECDNAMVNQIFKNAMWGQKSNFVSLPTDCPQRDERMGWTGDSFAFCGSAMYNMDCRLFYRKYLEDMFVAQREDGAVTDVVPFVPVVGWGNNGWGDVITELSYLYYRMYGDKDFLARCLPPVKKWVEYQRVNSNDCLRPDGGFGDWLSIVVNEANVVAMNTAFFAHSAQLLSEMCAILGDPDEKVYRELFEQIRARYLKEFLHGDGTVANGAQGDYLFAGAFGLLEKPQIGDLLEKKIHEADNSLTCGFMSVKYMLPVLCDTGKSDLAYELIQKDTFPSWGYSVRQGATTVWEHWDSWTAEKGFWNSEMNSFNHYSFGSCAEWYYSYVLGIRPSPQCPGFSEAIICPSVDFSGKVNRAAGAYDSVCGRIEVSWKTAGGQCVYHAHSEDGVVLKPDFGAYRVLDCKASAHEVTATLAPLTSEKK